MIPKNTKNIKGFLASQSPRRRELLSHFFPDFRLLRCHFDPEPIAIAGEKALKFHERCLNHKSLIAQKELKKNLQAETKALCVIVTSDTCVQLGNQFLGKPKDARDAQNMLSMLSNRTHIVWTSYRLDLIVEHTILRSVAKHIDSRVSFKKLSMPEIKQYIASGESSDKAGAYGFQGKAISFVSQVEGSYSSIMGLPILSIKRDLEKLFKNFECVQC